MATSPAVARQAVEAARQANGTDPQHPSVWQPWEQVGVDAGLRYRTEITGALAQLDAAQKAAARILDQAYASSAAIAGPLRDTGWTAWRKYMSAADDASSAIMTPALAAYDEAIARAKHAYDAALADASKSYKALLSSAQAGKNSAGEMPPHV